jgi:hypothetical protein
MLCERLFISLLTLLRPSLSPLTAEIIYTVDIIDMAIAMITPTPRIFEEFTIWIHHPYIEKPA